MKLSLNNFLYGIKQIVTGGGLEKDGITAVNDAGYLLDENDLLDAGTLPSGTTFTTDTNGFAILSVAATNTTVTSLGFWVPRDYDEATDELHVRFAANSAGATDTPTVTVTPKFQAVGGSSTAFSPATQVSAALSATAQLFDFVWRKQGLKRDTFVVFTFTSGAHTTDALQVRSLGVTYRSTLVSYHETDGARDGKNGSTLR